MKNRKFWVSLLAGVLAAVMLLSLLVGLLPTRVRALSSGEIRDQIDALEDQNAELEAQMAELDSQMSENLEEIQEMANQKKRIDRQIFLLYERIQVTNEQIAAYGVLIADKQEELDAANTRFSDLSDQYRERVRAMEENGELSYWSVLFKANNLADFLDRLNMIQEIAAADRQRLAELREAARQVSDAQQALETEKAALEETRAELDDTHETLSRKREEADDLLNALLARGEEYAQLLAQAEETQNRLMLEIAQKEQAFDEAAYLEWLATSVPPETTSPTDPGDSTEPGENGGDDDENGESGGYDEGWVSPLPYYTLTSPFGMRIHPLYGGWRMHYGVDLAAEQGTPIYAVRGGQVWDASENDSMGVYVQIGHSGGYGSVYMHMTNFVVSPGQYVSAGQLIGYVGSTGDSSGPHLHLGITYNGVYVNPMEYI